MRQPVVEGVREMILGQTSSMCYIGFQPPLSEAELESLPDPINRLSLPHTVSPFTQIEDDGSMTITFSMGESGFGDSPDVLLHNPENSFFMEYARRVALHLGDVSLDTTVRILDEGSLFNDDNHHRTR